MEGRTRKRRGRWREREQEQRPCVLVADCRSEQLTVTLRQSQKNCCAHTLASLSE